MKLSLVVCIALLGAVSAVSLKPSALQPERATYRFVQLWNRPESFQDYQRGEDEMEGLEHNVPAGAIKEEERWAHEGPHELKMTPGPACRSYSDCTSCATVTPCIWIPNDPHDTENKMKAGQGHCTEERAGGDDEENSAVGERKYECNVQHSFEVVDTPNDEHDDYAELHINGSPTNTDIAYLAGAEGVYTVAQEQGVGEGPESEAAGDTMEAGNTHEEYEGHHGDAKEVAAQGFKDKIAADEAQQAGR